MLDLNEDFAERVFRFESKLALISMKPDQSRNYTEYFTVTTLDGLVDDVNKLAYYAGKDDNYDAGATAEKVLGADWADTTNKAALSDLLVTLEGAAAEAMKSFMTTFCGELDLRGLLSANYKANYTDKGAAPVDPETAEYRVVAYDGDYIRRLFCFFLDEANKEDFLAFMQYKIAKWGGSYCTKELDEEIFDFYARKLGGQKKQKDSQKRTVELVNAWAGELLGKIYVTRYFSQKDKDTVLEMISEVLEVMKASIRKNDWLTEATKEKALAKLAKFVTKIGYPDKWKDHSSLVFDPSDDLLTMRKKVHAFDQRTEFFEKINTPKDKTKWEMHPHQVNAYFHPLNNEIVFPAAILQAPFYHPSADKVEFLQDAINMIEMGQDYNDLPHVVDAVNFGGIGAVIAHEITHGYDDQGRQFDEFGNAKDWWQEEDSELFKKKMDLMKQQAEKYKYMDKDSEKEITLNGDLTMGENLADLGGMSLAVQALEKKLNSKADMKPGDRERYFQLFFKSWANIWKVKQTNEDAVNKLATDPHAPGKFRCDLASNVNAFYEAFNVTEDDPMFIPLEARVQMW